jgi:hypothetical protein
MKPDVSLPAPNGGPFAIRWAKILGDWSFNDDEITYKGGSQRFVADGQEFPMGIIVDNSELRSGACKVHLTFSEISTGNFAGGIVLGYRPQGRYYVQVQLGAANAAYSVSEFVSGVWRPLMVAGPRNGLQADRKYSLQVSWRGQELRVSVDGVAVLESVIPRPLEGKQTGLVAAGNHEVQFSGFDVAADRPRAFVAMEYREPFDTFYHEVIKPQAEKMYDLVRMDEKAGAGVIFQDMQREIAQSDIVIAEITPANPNVFYELGYAQALGKPTILLAQRGGTLPFDIRSFRVVYYDDSIGGKTRVEQDLAKHLEAIAQSAG